MGSSAHVVGIKLPPDQQINLDSKYQSQTMNLFCLVMLQVRLLLGMS